MNDLEEQRIQTELDAISKNIEIILSRIKNLDPVNREEASNSMLSYCGRNHGVNQK